MRAAVRDRFGAPSEVVEVREVETPVPTEDEVLVRVHAASLNFGDWYAVEGRPWVGRPSMGAWVTYGLGSESQNLPGFVVLNSGGGASAGSGNWTNGFLPAQHQGVMFATTGPAIRDLAPARPIAPNVEVASRELHRRLNELPPPLTGRRFCICLP